MKWLWTISGTAPSSMMILKSWAGRDAPTQFPRLLLTPTPGSFRNSWKRKVQNEQFIFSCTFCCHFPFNAILWNQAVLTSLWTASTPGLTTARSRRRATTRSPRARRPSPWWPRRCCRTPARVRGASSSGTTSGWSTGTRTTSGACIEPTRTWQSVV